MQSDIPMTIRELLDVFGEWSKRNLSPGTIEEYARHFRRLEKAAGEKELCQVRESDLTSWASSWHSIQACQRLFNWARDYAEVVSRNPFGKVKKPPIGQRKRVLTRRQILSLMRFASRNFRPFLLCLAQTISRPQEARKLCWEQIESADEGLTIQEALIRGRAFFSLDSFKGKARRTEANAIRVIPIPRRFGRFLARQLDQTEPPTGIIFRNSKGRPFSNNAIRLRFKRLRKRAGLDGRDHRGEKVVCYTFRHSMATQAVKRGVRDKTLAEMMGHTSTRTTARYMHLDAGHLLDAIEVATATRPAGLTEKKCLSDPIKGKY